MLFGLCPGVSKCARGGIHGTKRKLEEALVLNKQMMAARDQALIEKEKLRADYERRQSEMKEKIARVETQPTPAYDRGNSSPFSLAPCHFAHADGVAPFSWVGEGWHNAPGLVPHCAFQAPSLLA